MDNSRMNEPFIPRNIRQVGETGGNDKVYMEDYVITYLNQIESSDRMGSRAILLLGEIFKTINEDYYYIYGAICSPKERLEEGRPLFDDEDRTYLSKKRNDFFPDMEVLGWVLLEHEFNRISDNGIWTIGEGEFHPEGKLYFRIDREDDLEQVHVYKQGIMQKIPGYQIFYDKNEVMQAYLIHWNEEHKNISCERINDRVARQFRSVYTEKQEENHQRKMMSLFSAASLLLLMLLCVTGITTINQYEKMKQVEEALNQIAIVMEEERSGTGYEEQVRLENERAAMQEDTNDWNAAEGEASVNGELQESSLDTQYSDEQYLDSETADISSTNNEESVLSHSVYTTYVVQEGDTLLKISRRFYQTADKVGEICAINGIEDPDSIFLGQKILLP